MGPRLLFSVLLILMCGPFSSVRPDDQPDLCYRYLIYLQVDIQRGVSMLRSNHSARIHEGEEYLLARIRKDGNPVIRVLQEEIIRYRLEGEPFTANRILKVLRMSEREKPSLWSSFRQRFQRSENETPNEFQSSEEDPPALDESDVVNDESLMSSDSETQEKTKRKKISANKMILGGLVAVALATLGTRFYVLNFADHPTQPSLQMIKPSPDDTQGGPRAKEVDYRNRFN